MVLIEKDFMIILLELNCNKPANAKAITFFILRTGSVNGTAGARYCGANPHKSHTRSNKDLIKLNSFTWVQKFEQVMTLQQFLSQH